MKVESLKKDSLTFSATKMWAEGQAAISISIVTLYIFLEYPFIFSTVIYHLLLWSTVNLSYIKCYTVDITTFVISFAFLNLYIIE